MTTVFLSYAHDDEARIRVIKRALQGRGHDVFWDEDIPTGENWRQVLEERVRRVQCVLVAWSSKSVTSRYVSVECELAVADDRLLPLLLEEVAIPKQFERLQAADLRDWIGNVKDPEWQRLLAHIEARGIREVAGAPVDGSAFMLDTAPVAASTAVPQGEAPARREGLLESVVETEIRMALDLAPVQTDAFKDLTTVRARGDEGFAAQVRKLEAQGYTIVEARPGQSLLERRRRFSWVVAAILTLIFIFPVLIYIGIYFFLPKSHRVYVVQVE